MQWTRDNFTVTTDKSKLDMEFVVDSLHSVFKRSAPRDRIEKAFRNSLCLVLLDGRTQIGFVRAVTDASFVSWVTDLYVHPDYRGKGLGKWLMACARAHPDLAHTRFVFSSVPEHCSFYEHIGFRPMERGYSMMPPEGTQPVAPTDPPEADR